MIDLTKLEIICIECQLPPSKIEEYLPGEDEDSAWREGDYQSPEHYVSEEEGTFNSENGHFVCTQCYIDIGMPSSDEGWVAP